MGGGLQKQSHQWSEHGPKVKIILPRVYISIADNAIHLNPCLVLPWHRKEASRDKGIRTMAGKLLVAVTITMRSQAACNVQAGRTGKCNALSQTFRSHHFFLEKAATFQVHCKWKARRNQTLGIMRFRNTDQVWVIILEGSQADRPSPSVPDSVWQVAGWVCPASQTLGWMGEFRNSRISGQNTDQR